MDIAKTIYDKWFELRAEGRFDDVLPRACSFRALTENGQASRYDTHEHRVLRWVSISSSGPDGGDGVAGLVETYFSERLDDGWVLGWGLNLHVHVVEVENETLQ